MSANNGRAVTPKSQRTQTLVDLRHARDELDRAIEEATAADIATPVHFAQSMDSPLSRVRLAIGTCELVLRRLNVDRPSIAKKLVRRIAEEAE